MLMKLTRDQTLDKIVQLKPGETFNQPYLFDSLGQ
jgi:hypothetical protein